jgi:hypothetical protein
MQHNYLPAADTRIFTALGVVQIFARAVKIVAIFYQALPFTGCPSLLVCIWMFD